MYEHVAGKLGGADSGRCAPAQYDDYAAKQAAPPSGNISEAHGRLGKAIMVLDEETHAIEQRLSVTMRPEHPQANTPATGNQAVQPSRSEMADIVNAEALRIEIVAFRLRSVLARLDL